MKVLILGLTLLVAIAFVGSAMATPPGKNVEYEGGWAGKVIYDGTIHGPDRGMKCPDCHPALFPMKKSPAGTYKKADMIAGKNCGACHNGTKSFAILTGDFATCTKCHKPAAPEAPTPAPAP
jgi:c(7)-type cytochrome triheme protein